MMRAVEMPKRATDLATQGPWWIVGMAITPKAGAPIPTR